MRRVTWTFLLAACLAVALPASAFAATGFRGPHFSGNGTQVTGAKSESKLAYAHGAWWAVMWDEVSGDNLLWRLDAGTQTWQKTSTVVDPRAGMRADVLFDGDRLYVASHQYSNTGAAGFDARLYRYSWTGSGWVADLGFPVKINNQKTESLVIDKDSTGTLWATWVQGTDVYVNHTAGDDRSWSTPFVLPAAGASGVNADDISSVVAFGGDKIGVMWSNQTTASVVFSVHDDGAPADQWRAPETVLSGPGQADDHINLKAAADGRVFAAIKTDRAEPAAPLVVLGVRGSSGGWDAHTVMLKSDRGTRPIVVLDEGNRQAHVFATAPEAGGAIYRKSSSMDDVAFGPGRGTVYIEDEASPDVNDATSTKQPATVASGLVVLASDDTSLHYWHNATGVGPAPLEAEFRAVSPVTGEAPLSVAFADASTGEPTSWRWDFGDGTTSSEREPTHTYAEPGTYTVTLTVTDAGGDSDTRERAGMVTVTAPAPVSADFTATTPVTGTVPLPVAFADASTGGPQSWSWDFGDGGSSTERNPSHTYTTPGTYSVSLTVTDTDGDTSTRTRENLVVAAAPPVTGDIGYRGVAFAGNGTQVTGAKTESKLWHHDGAWWSVMWDTATADNYIYRLDAATQTWQRTGTVVDPRSGTRADVLWKGGKLYVASHVYSNTFGAGLEARLYRFSYDDQTRSYALDGGFPSAISNYATESLVIDRDSTGKLWATWAQDRQVYVNRTVGDDRTWGTPFALPAVDASNLDLDDVTSLVAFGSSIGLMWSNQTTDEKLFAVHADGAADTDWGPAETVLSGPDQADDHVNLKAASDGRVFAAVKTDRSGAQDPLVILSVRGRDGGWQDHAVGLKSDRITRPIVVLDEDRGVAHVFATGPEAGGVIYRKSTPMDAISFASGRGTPFIQDGDSDDLNDATSTKQNVTAATGLVVLASNDTTRYYWHNSEGVVAPPLQADFEPTSPISGPAPLTIDFADRSSSNAVSWSWDFGDGATSTARNPTHTYSSPGTYTVRLTVADAGGATSTRTRADLVTAQPPRPVASFTTSGATTGIAPLTVAFQDTSSNSPSSWFWTFGDGTTSTQRNPSHTYTTAGTFTVSLTVGNVSGTDTITRTGLVTVTRRTTLSPVADAFVASAARTTNFGTATTLRVRRRDEERSYLRFTVSGTGGTVTATRLRLWTTGSAESGGSLHLLPGGTWTETGITYANAPAVTTPALATVGPVVAGTWTEVALPAGAITGDGTYTLVLRNTAQGGGSASAIFASRQHLTAANRPQLVVDSN